MKPTKVALWRQHPCPYLKALTSPESCRAQVTSQVQRETPCNAAQAASGATYFHFLEECRLPHLQTRLGSLAPTPATPGSSCLASLCWSREHLSLVSLTIY